MTNTTKQPHAPEQPADAGPVERPVRRHGAYLPTASDCSNTAEQCRAMGISVGDTITGREHGPGGRWHEARLTLLWIGRQECMWLVQRRTKSATAWTEPEEEGNWTLDCRRWRFTPIAADMERH